MKKILFACATLGLIASANAQEGVDHKVNGEMRFRYYNNANADLKKGGADTKWHQRTKLGYTLTKGEDLSATAELLVGRSWGMSNPAIPSGLDDGTNNVKLQTAVIYWKAMENVAISIGRSGLDLADGTLVSSNDWFQTPYAFDGVTATYFTEFANISVVGRRGVDGVVAPVAAAAPSTQPNGDELNTAHDTEVNFYGFNVNFKNLPEFLKLADIVVVQSKGSSIPGAPTATENSDKLRYGLTLKGDIAGFDYRGSYHAYSGEDKAHNGTKTDTEGSMYDLELGYTLADVMNLRIHGLYHSDSGDKTSANTNERYDPFFYNKHNNAGMMDFLEWGNLTYWKLGASLEPMEMLTVGLDYYSFSRTEKGDGVVAYVGGASTPAGTATGDAVGTEIDLWAKKSLSNGAEFMLRYSMFDADKDTFGPTGEDTFTQIFAQAKFGF